MTRLFEPGSPVLHSVLTGLVYKVSRENFDEIEQSLDVPTATKLINDYRILSTTILLHVTKVFSR